jgi:hypothetical protein
MAFRLVNGINWIFWLGTVALILIAVTGCNEASSVNTALNGAVNTAIESPVRNTCQSGDWDPTFPKCHY